MNEKSLPSSDPGPASAVPGAEGQRSGTVVVADAKPLSLLATAGVLHHAGMRCVCARTSEAVLRACGMPLPRSAEALLADVDELAGEVSRAVEPLRVDDPRIGVRGGHAATKSSGVDLIVWDVGDEVATVLQTLAEIRTRFPEVPAVLLADPRWAGLEKRAESLAAPTRCLFKPIDPASLVSVCEPLLWMPALQSIHRQRGSRPNRPGWVTL